MLEIYYYLPLCVLAWGLYDRHIKGLEWEDVQWTVNTTVALGLYAVMSIFHGEWTMFFLTGGATALIIMYLFFKKKG